MLLKIATSYLALEVLIALLAVAITYRGRRRRLRKRDERTLEGFVETDEAFVDPTTGIQQRVWFNQATGERRYVNIEQAGGS